MTRQRGGEALSRYSRKANLAAALPAVVAGAHGNAVAIEHTRGVHVAVALHRATYVLVAIVARPPVRAVAVTRDAHPVPVAVVGAGHVHARGRRGDLQAPVASAIGAVLLVLPVRARQDRLARGHGGVAHVYQGDGAAVRTHAVNVQGRRVLRQQHGGLVIGDCA